MNNRQCKRRTKGSGQGPCSYWMQEPGLVFDALNICQGQHILEMGCGAGDYALQAARLTGFLGQVTAVDHLYNKNSYVSPTQIQNSHFIIPLFSSAYITSCKQAGQRRYICLDRKQAPILPIPKLMN